MKNLNLNKIALMLVLLASSLTSCLDDEIHPKDITSKDIEVTDDFERGNVTFSNANQRSIITIDDYGRVQTGDVDITITHITVYSKYNVLLFDWAGCGTHDCQIDPTFVSSLTDDRYIVATTLYDSKTSTTSVESKMWYL